MKKIIITAAAFALTLTLSTTAFAAGHAGTACARRSACESTIYASGCTFVDANGDGVCDNRDSHCTTFVDADKDGVCDNCGTHCTNFVDADKDGVCDNLDGYNGSGHQNECAASGVIDQTVRHHGHRGNHH